MMLNTSSSSDSSEDEFIYVRRPKIYRERINYMNQYDEVSFFERFRLTKDTVMSLLEQIEPLIRHPTNRGGAVKPLQQLLLTLRFFASGNMQLSVADYMGVSRATASRIIKRVSAAIASLSRQYIKMCETDDEMVQAAAEFYAIARFPQCIGAIDCTLIPIKSPGGEDAEIYRSRKGFFALNVQTISDPSLKIRNIVARWPGSVHDQTIFNNSTIKQRFEAGDFGRFVLIGDSGYGLKAYLMTQLHDARTEAENLYNESLIRTRNVVERQYGVWKQRFPILRNGLKLNLDVTMDVIVATAVLHNIAIENGDLFPGDINVGEQEDNLPQFQGNLDNGRHYRELFIRQHFAQL